jgi:hypothetical protein
MPVPARGGLEAFATGGNSQDAGTAARSSSARDPSGLTASERTEKQKILDALAMFAGNQSRAAKFLGMARRTFVARLDRYDIARPKKGQEQGPEPGQAPGQALGQALGSTAPDGDPEDDTES